MSDSDQLVSAPGTQEDDPAERLAQHLLYQPHDLIDASPLFQRFQVTTINFSDTLPD